MPRSYQAFLKGNRVKWVDDAPRAEQPVRVEITVVAEETGSRGDRMAEALRKLAEVKAFSKVAEPSEWQREIRGDRPLPDRNR